ncbi:hypothetical protein CMT37_12890 [Elizabethkingia anophelis]|nr:hypothetical protein [Elizabethkingia anophelis]
MKNNIKSISGIFTRYIYGITVILAVTMTINSCSSRDDRPGESTGTDTVLKFSIAGIENSGDITSVKNASLAGKVNSYSQLSDVIASEKTTSFGDFDIITYAEATKKDSSSGTIASTSKKMNVAASSSPMSPLVKYRIVICYAGTNTVVANAVGTPGVDPVITVPSGQAYDWYAYSINESTVPAIDINGNIPRSNLINKDLLYTKSTNPIIPQVGQNELNIVFNRKTVKLSVELNTRGIFGKIENNSAVELGQDAGSGFTSIVQTGDFNVNSGTYSNLSPVPAITGSQMENTIGAGGDLGTTKTATFYSAIGTTIPVNSLKVRLNNMNITLDDATTRSFTANTIIPYTNTSAINTALGSEYKITAQMVESGISVGNAVWARTNLHYADYATDKYRFLPHNDVKIGNLLNLLNLIQLGGATSAQVKPANLYWNWNSLTPEGTPGSGDPCSKVYPEGKWKTPTQAQLSSLGAAPTDGLYADAPLLIGTAHYATKWTAPSPSNNLYPAHSRQLFMPIYGYRSGTQIYYSAGALLSGVLGSAVSNYWSIDGNSTNGMAYTGNFNVLLGVLTLTGSLSNISTDSNRGMSVRCVKS